MEQKYNRLAISCIFLGFPITLDTLNEVAELSNVMSIGEDYMYLPGNVRTECERVIPDVDGIKSTDTADAFLSVPKSSLSGVIRINGPCPKV